MFKPFNILLETKKLDPNRNIPLRMTTINMVKRYVELSSQYISAIAMNDKKEVARLYKRLTTLSKGFCRRRVRELPEGVKKDLRTNNKALQELTSRFLKEINK